MEDRRKTIQMREVKEKEPQIDITALFIDFAKKHRNVFITEIGEQVFIYRSIGRGEYKKLLSDTRFTDIEKEEMICQQCLLYPDMDDYNWDDCDAGIPSKLKNEILKNSFLDSIKNRNNLKDFYRAEMYDLDNQITCIINEAFPNIDIEEIEDWDVEKTTKYLSRAEWKLHNLRGIPFVEPQGEYVDQDDEQEEYYEQEPAKQKHVEQQPVVNPNKETTIRGTSKKEKLTPDKIKQREEFLRKFPEFANDDIINMGMKGLEQQSVDTTSPALRPGF